MKYAVKRYWELCDTVEVDASSVAHAVETAHALPIDNTNAEFVPDSMNTDTFIDVQELVTSDAEATHPEGKEDYAIAHH
jgi:hypothetical protein